MRTCPSRSVLSEARWRRGLLPHHLEHNGFAVVMTPEAVGTGALLVVSLDYVSLAEVNAIAYKRWTISVGAQAFLANRLIGAGLMQPYLAQACETEPDLLLCSRQEEIKKFVFVDEFLWGRGQMAKHVGVTNAKAAEAGALALRVILDDPWSVATLFAGDAARLARCARAVPGGAAPCPPASFRPPKVSSSFPFGRATKGGC